MVTDQVSIKQKAVWAALQTVMDPEIPIVSVCDLGIVRDVDEEEVIITPTYSGCPATEMIGLDIRMALDKAGFDDVKVRTSTSPPWTTDWITPKGREKLIEAGIAPPVQSSGSKQGLFSDKPNIPCPLCQSTNTILVSQFGSTACKALYKCGDCLEPFDYFKCI
jgi:ring-1,2-phenylacetyl-CoA epoxidase subunit PaaD